MHEDVVHVWERGSRWDVSAAGHGEVDGRGPFVSRNCGRAGRYRVKWFALERSFCGAGEEEIGLNGLQD